MQKRIRMVYTFTLLISGLLANPFARAEEEIDISAVDAQPSPTSTPVQAAKPKAQPKPVVLTPTFTPKFTATYTPSPAPNAKSKAATPTPTPKPKPTEKPKAVKTESPAPAEAEQNTGAQFSLSLDALGQGILYNYNLSSQVFGAGGQVFADWRPIQLLSFGVGGEYTHLFGSALDHIETVDVGGRVFPLPTGTTPGGEFYLQGGVGLNPFEPISVRTGHFHGFAGPGYRLFLQKTMALDMGIQYESLSPIAVPYHGLSAKFGLTFLFGRTEWPKPAEAENGGTEANGRLAVDQSVPTGYVTGSSTYAWQVGDDLKKVAAKIYGDPALYSLLVDANKELLMHPARMREGAQLRVPAIPVSPEALDVARDRSLHDATYLIFQKASERLPYEEDPNWKGPSRYTWEVGDSLQTLSEKLYDDDQLYPLLVDANEGRLIHPANLKPGVVLIVPGKPALKWLDFIHEKVWTEDKYIWWKNVSRRDSNSDDDESDRSK